MKILIIIITAMLLTVNTNCIAQDTDEVSGQKKKQIERLMEQIAALKVYLGYVKKGYDIVQKGLTIIGDIKNGKFNLDKDYLESLEHVKPAIRNSAKVAYVIAMQQLIERNIRVLYNHCISNEYLTADEVQSLVSIYANLLRESEISIDELETVITSNELQMKDNERLDRIDKIFDEMQNMYAFTRSFGNSARLLTWQRNKESFEIENMQKLNNVTP